MRITYWVTTGLMCLLFFASAMMYFFNYPRAETFFISLNFPTWIIYPLATLKILGILAVLTQKVTFLKELAYAGFLFDAILALTAHLIVGDGEFMGGLIALILITISWVFDRKIFGNITQNTPIKETVN